MMRKFLAFFMIAILCASQTFAEPSQKLLSEFTNPSTGRSPLINPLPPHIEAEGYVLMEAETGKILASKNPDKRMSPASLTKMMTMFIISEALKAGHIHLNDEVVVSKHAYQMGGSKMFLKAGQHVAVEDLIRGIVVVSGNDACIAMAEHIAGSERGFVALMNQQAELLGMKNTHYTDATGMPHENHYSTPRDLAILAQHLIDYFPQFYSRWYHQKWFTFNGIKQPNRNRLLWRDSAVDGVKTGHTDSAGYCLVSSAKKNNMRLVSVLMGAKNDMARTEQSQHLLNFGFRFYEYHSLYKAGSILVEPRVWGGLYKTIPAGIKNTIELVIPTGAYKDLKANVELFDTIKAPITKGAAVGELKIMLHGKVLAKHGLVALEDDPKGGVWSRFKDFLSLSWHNIWHKKQASDTESQA